MDHKHIFIQTGSGCEMPAMPSYDPKKCCDVDYKCKCGEKFTTYTSTTGNRYLPEEFETKQMSETKQAEQNAIIDNFINNI